MNCHQAALRNGMSKIIVVRHHEGDLDDTASVHLAENHYQVEHCYPFDTDSLKSDLPFDQLSGQTTANAISGTIIMGGAQHVTQLDQFPYLQTEIDWILACINADVPVIGICLGAQLLAQALGGEVSNHSEGLCEYGYEPIYPVNDNDWLTESMHMVQAHFQGFTLPPNATALARGDNFSHQAFSYKDKAFGFQFHPEVHSTMFEQWLKADWADEFNSLPGARPGHNQLPDNRKYNAAQTQWFKGFLDRLFPTLAPA